MKKRIADSLKEFGFTGTADEFRAALVAVKSERFADVSIDELTFTRDEAGEYCRLVRERLKAHRLPRSFILRALVGTRKNKPKVKV